MFNKPKRFVLFTLTVVLIALTATFTLTQESWFPSEWGADDRRGAVNRLTPEKVLQAASLIKTGEVFQLGRVYESGIPVFGTRHYSLRIPAMSGPLGETKRRGLRRSSAVRSVRSAPNLMDSVTSVSATSSTTAWTNTISPKPKASQNSVSENVGPIVTRGCTH